MRIVGSVDGKDIMLLDNDGNFIVMESGYVRDMCLANADKTVEVAQKTISGGFRSFKAGRAINIDGRISARCGYPIYIKEILNCSNNCGEVTINNINLGNVNIVRVIVEDRGRYVNAQIIYFSKIGEIGILPDDVDISVLFKGLHLVNIARDLKFPNSWIIATVVDGKLDVLIRYSSYINSLIKGLEKRKIIKIPYCNTSTCKVEDTYKSNCVYIDSDSLDMGNAWNEMLGKWVSCATSIKVDMLGNGVYKVSKYKNSDRVELIRSVVFKVNSDGSLGISQVRINNK